MGLSLLSETMSDECGDVIAVAAKLEQQLADVGLRRYEHKEDGLRRHGGYNRNAAAMFEHGGEQLATLERGTQLVRWTNDWRDSRRNILWIEAGDGLAIDQQAVSTEDDRRFDPFSLPNRGDEITDTRHRRTSKSGGEARDRNRRSQAAIIA
jgi:hypothetical protein